MVSISLFLNFQNLTILNLGQYLGDIWVMDFSTLKYTKSEIISQVDPFREDGYLKRADA